MSEPPAQSPDLPVSPDRPVSPEQPVPATGPGTTTVHRPEPVTPFVSALPAVPPLFGVAWTAPVGPPPWSLVVAAAGSGLLVAAAVDAAPGLAISLAVLVGAAGLASVGWAGAESGRRALSLVGVALGAVATLRDSEWLVLLCLLGALGLAALVAVDGRRWFTVFAAPVMLGIAALRSVPWLRRLATRLPARHVSPWLNGAAIGLTVATVVGLLLGSADRAFAEVFSRLVPDVEVGTVPARVIVAGVAAALVLGAGFATRSALAWRDGGLVQLPRRPVVEWLLPLLAVDAVLLAFLVVQATVLFGGADVVLREAGVTYAERARTGFGQLVAVTVITLLLLAWAAVWARRGTGGERSRTLLLAGGALVAMSLAMVVSALRRLWLYEQVYGWTVTRITSGAFEFWLAFVLVALAVLWYLGRTGWSARLVTGSLGVLLLVLGVTGPDALAASWNVDRYAATGKIDVLYLQLLSDDAVPALSRLPEPLRSCVLAARAGSDRADGWQSWNLARHRAASVTPGPSGPGQRTTCGLAP